jgi:ParB family transcriptional regulator, chromosome partitioning protein
MTTPKRPTGLGRGLSALLGDLTTPAPVTPTAPDVQPASTATSGGPRLVPTEKLIANPHQPRRRFDEAALDELAASIREKGVLLPLLVRPRPDGNFEIVAGERRWRAAQRAQAHELPVVIKELSDSETLEIALIENIQRQDLNAIEEAEGFRRLMDEFGHTQEALARLVSKSRSHVANILRLLDLPAKVRDYVAEGALSMGHAKALVAAPDPVAAAEEAIKYGYSVRDVEQLVQRAKKPSGAAAAGRALSKVKDADTAALERDLSQSLGMHVEVQDAGGRGVLSIRYTSLDQLDELCRRLSGGGV